jgi:hypothetical protein
MSSTTVNKANGEPITFNFKLENGLPVKPIISPAYQEGFLPSKNRHAISVYLEKNDIVKLGNFKIKKQYVLKKDKENEVLFLINEHYLALGQISDIIIEALNENSFDLYFYDENQTFIIGLTSDSNKV